ncbi:hypothetical protein HS088_TW15G00922 [Tripterygium wilfordii]|uniref:Uncharacterized protein n=1 Tax=Tripterygium wilfordii TaxID=458696 RepID=A0A7J7CMY7_TRIWF|nr:hypothetical protein HS088_TW15G00922 [Tripterygium wilfordii]
MCLVGWDHDGKAVFDNHLIDHARYSVIPYTDRDPRSACRYNFNGEKIPYGKHWDLISMYDFCKLKGWTLVKNGGANNNNGSTSAQPADYKDLKKEVIQLRRTVEKQSNLLQHLYRKAGVIPGHSDKLKAVIDGLFDKRH